MHTPAPWSQRRAASRIALAWCAALLAGCSLLSPPSLAPQQSIAVPSDASIEPSPSPSATAAPTSPSTETSSPPASPEPTAAAMRWRSVVKPLASPAAWLDFGFAGNGDVIAIGTRHAAAEPLRLFVARFSASGRKRSERDLSRAVTPLGSDWVSIDPTNDSIVIDDYDHPTNQFTLRRFSSATGRVLSSTKTPSGINRLAVDAYGHEYGLPQYGVGGNVYAAVVRLDARGQVKFGVDYWLRPLTAGARPGEPGVLAFPTAIAIARDGRVIIVDEPDVDATYQDGTPRRMAVVTSLGPDLSSPRQWELPVEWPFGSQAFGAWSHALAIAGAADGSVYVGEPVLDETGRRILGGRVRQFSASGELLGTWGLGTPGSGVARASHPAVDAAGHLWVIDVDPATHRSVIAVLEPG